MPSSSLVCAHRPRGSTTRPLTTKPCSCTHLLAQTVLRSQDVNVAVVGGDRCRQRHLVENGFATLVATSQFAHSIIEPEFVAAVAGLVFVDENTHLLRLP